jgi:SpoVK/Ycf46/Vps4 family AAA+-type ATPase
MNDQTKQQIRAKATSYIKRAEQLKALIKNGPVKKKALCEDGTDRGNSKNNRDDDDDGDSDRRRMMQKFEGKRHNTLFLTLITVTGAIVSDPNVSFADVIGLEQAKDALKEAVILPVKFPQLFQGTTLIYISPHTSLSLSLSHRQTKTLGWHSSLWGTTLVFSLDTLHWSSHCSLLVRASLI